MPGYISSNANRFYAVLESNYGQAAAPTQSNRFAASRVEAQQIVEPSRRLDKTGSRTYLGASLAARRRTAFEIRSYLTAWAGSGFPSCGAFFQAGLGSSPVTCSGLAISSVQNQAEFQTVTPHGLQSGSAVSYSGEIRFVTSAPDPSTLILNAPFSNALTVGALMPPTITYRAATALPSVSIYDYWDPTTSMSRMVSGAAVDTVELLVSGDYHEFRFAGPASDLITANSFTAGEGALSSFPLEPALAQFNASPVPGHLGQVWLGNTLSQFFTLASASIEIKNNVGLRSEEFGSSFPRAITAGLRQVTSKITLFAQDDSQTTALYAAAKRRVPVSALLQLGEQQGQLMGIYLPQLMPVMPAYDDSQTRLQWQFNNNVAQGATDDEIYIAFA